MKKSRDWEIELAGVAGDFGLEIVEISLQKESAGRFLRVFIDKEGGVGLSDCEEYHRKILPLLEHVEYDYLEVCSPGADRPLKSAKDYQRNAGKRIEVKLFSPRNGRKQLVGTLERFDDEGFTIKTEQDEESFSYKETAIVRPVIDVEARLRDFDEEEEG